MFSRLRIWSMYKLDQQTFLLQRKRCRFARRHSTSLRLSANTHRSTEYRPLTEELIRPRYQKQVGHAYLPRSSEGWLPDVRLDLCGDYHTPGGASVKPEVADLRGATRSESVERERGARVSIHDTLIQKMAQRGGVER